MSDYLMANLQESGLPEALESERAVLGSVLRDSGRIVEAARFVRPADFSLDSHRKIFQAILDVCERDGKADIVSVAQYLADHKHIEAVGGWAYVTDLTSLPRNVELENHFGILRSKAISRDLLAFGEALTGRVYSSGQSGLEIASWAVSELSRIAEDGEQKSEVWEANEMCLDATRRLLDAPEVSEVLPTGIRGLDEITGGGIRRGELWVIGAAPSRGKTTLARQIAKHTVCRNIPAYVHSGEMTRQSWLDVTACLIGMLRAWKVREPGLLNLSEKEGLRGSLRHLSTLPLFISDSGGLTLDRLIWNATRLTKRKGIQLFAVDYAQIINAPGRDPREKVTNVAQKLRLFAKDHNVATLLLSQSPRPEGRNINTRPTMFSLKESGALEEAAHVVVLPYRPVDTETGKFDGKDELIIGKNRWGAIGSVDVWLNGEYLRFEER